MVSIFFLYFLKPFAEIILAFYCIGVNVDFVNEIHSAMPCKKKNLHLNRSNGPAPMIYLFVFIQSINSCDINIFYYTRQKHFPSSLLPSDGSIGHLAPRNRIIYWKIGTGLIHFASVHLAYSHVINHFTLVIRNSAVIVRCIRDHNRMVSCILVLCIKLKSV